jgi:hypothetical protein
VGYLALTSQYRHVLHLQTEKNSDINPAQAVGKASDDPQSLAFAERSGKSPRNDAVNSTLGVHHFLIVRQKSVVAGLHRAPISLEPPRHVSCLS